MKICEFRKLVDKKKPNLIFADMENKVRGNIRRYRLVRGLSQTELGDLVGLDTSAISRIERGPRGIDSAEVERIARALGVTLPELYRDLHASHDFEVAEIKRKIGQRIREKRDALKLTQPDLAQRLNVNKQSVSDWERGKTMPEPGRMPLIAQILGTSVLELFGELFGESEKEPLTSAYDERIPPAFTKSILEAPAEFQESFDLLFQLWKRGNPEFRQDLLSLLHLICRVSAVTATVDRESDAGAGAS